MRSIKLRIFFQLKPSSTCERYSIGHGDKPAFDQCNNQKKNQNQFDKDRLSTERCQV